MRVVEKAGCDCVRVVEKAGRVVTARMVFPNNRFQALWTPNAPPAPSYRRIQRLELHTCESCVAVASPTALSLRVHP